MLVAVTKMALINITNIPSFPPTPFPFHFE